MTITSNQNPRVRWVHSLISQTKQRRQEGTFVVEGVRLVEEALAAGWQPMLVFHSRQLSQRGQKSLQILLKTGCELIEISPAVMASLSDTETSQGILAVFPASTLPLPTNPTFLLITDALRDPGNLGTLLRTGLAAGVQGVLLAPGSTDAWSPKVLRAGMGAHFRLPIHTLTWAEIEQTTKIRSAPPLTLYLAASEGGQSAWQADLRSPLALIVGSEAEGAGTKARLHADLSLSIPMPGGSESLNAAVAAAILMFEVVRQRST